MIPILLFSAYSGTGKTTFLQEFVPLFIKRGIKTGYLKHHHGDYFSKKKKDTTLLRASGIERAVLVAKDAVIIEDTPDMTDGDPIRYYTERYFQGYQLVIIEGFKNNQTYPKIVMLRSPDKNINPEEETLLRDPNVIAIVGNAPSWTSRPIFTFEDKERLFEYVISYLKLER